MELMLYYVLGVLLHPIFLAGKWVPMNYPTSPKIFRLKLTSMADRGGVDMRHLGHIDGHDVEEGHMAPPTGSATDVNYNICSNQLWTQSNLKYLWINRSVHIAVDFPGTLAANRRRIIHPINILILLIVDLMYLLNRE